MSTHSCQCQHPLSCSYLSTLFFHASMASLPQNRLPILMPHTPRIPRLIRVHCSATAPPKPHRPNLEPPKSQPPPLIDKQSLKSTWSHRAWVAGGCSTVLVSLARSTAGVAAGSHVWVEPILASFMGYLIADLGSGVYHWAIDNYGDAETPVFGDQIEAFQGHHKLPWTITRREFANNLHALARAVTFAVLPINLFCDDSVLLGFVGVCSGCIMFSQQSHAWAHMTRSRMPGPVLALQDSGVLVSPLQHAMHHRSPYNSNYCIVSGVWNNILDSSRFFEAMEMVIFFRFGVRPRSWSEPNSDWTEEVQTTSLES